MKRVLLLRRSNTDELDDDYLDNSQIRVPTLCVLWCVSTVKQSISLYESFVAKKKKNQLSDWLWFLGYLFFFFVSAAGQGAMIRGILDLFALLCYHLCLFFTRHSGMWQPDAHSPTELKSAGKGLKSKNTQCDKMPHGDIIPAVQSAEQVGKKLLKLLVLRLKNVVDAVQAMCCCCFFIVL